MWQVYVCMGGRERKRQIPVFKVITNPIYLTGCTVVLVTEKIVMHFTSMKVCPWIAKVFPENVTSIIFPLEDSYALVWL